MLRILIVLLLALAGGAPAPKNSLRCRVVAFAGTKVRFGPWKDGATGCLAVRKDAEFAARMFGDVVIYKMQVESAGQRATLRLELEETPEKQ